MKKYIFTIATIGIIIIGIWLVFSKQAEKNLSSEETKILQENFKEELILFINYGNREPEILNSEFKEGMTAFDLLKKKTEELNITLKTKTYDMGIFIEAIGDKENSQEGKYWTYYVNGEMPIVASDKQELKKGDKVEFKFEESPF